MSAVRLAGSVLLLIAALISNPAGAEDGDNPPAAARQTAVGKAKPVAMATLTIHKATGVVLLPTTGWPAAGGQWTNATCVEPACVAAACRAVTVAAHRAMPTVPGSPAATIPAAVNPTPVNPTNWHAGCRFTLTGFSADLPYRVTATMGYTSWLPPQPPGSEFGFKAFCPSPTGSFTLTAANPSFTCPNLQLIRMP